MNATPAVLFLSVHNSGRSLAARVLLDHYTGGQLEVFSAGSEPADQLNASVVALLREQGAGSRTGVRQTTHGRDGPRRPTSSS